METLVVKAFEKALHFFIGPQAQFYPTFLSHEQLDKRLPSLVHESEGARGLQTVVRYVRSVQIFR